MVNIKTAGIKLIKKMKKVSVGDALYVAVNYILATVLGIICLYPVLYAVSVSISNPVAALRGEVWLFPVGFSLNAYKRILQAPQIWMYYYNTVWYTVVGTFFNVIVTVMLAYPLSKKYFVLRAPITFMVVFTMFFGGGLIPTFLLVNSLGLYGTRWVMVFLGLISTFNMIMARTFFQTLPEELFECARIEGATEFKIIYTIAMPLSKPLLAVLALYYGVHHWNTYFGALVYLPRAELQPIQVLLRRIVLQNSDEFLKAQEVTPTPETVTNQIKFAAIVFTMAPIMCLYPFLQKYFVKGVMIGALKG